MSRYGVFRTAGSGSARRSAATSRRMLPADALEIVAFNWNSKEKTTRRFPVSKIGRSHYRIVDFGPVTLRDDLGVMLIPARNPAVRNLRIDRIILVPER